MTSSRKQQTRHKIQLVVCQIHIKNSQLLQQLTPCRVGRAFFTIYEPIAAVLAAVYSPGLKPTVYMYKYIFYSVCQASSTVRVRAHLQSTPLIMYSQTLIVLTLLRMTSQYPSQLEQNCPVFIGTFHEYQVHIYIQWTLRRFDGLSRAGADLTKVHLYSAQHVPTNRSWVENT